MDLADAAGCAPKTVYMAMQKEDFRQMFVAAVRGQLHADLPRVVDAYVGKALEGSHQHGSTLMQITGLYNPKKQIDADIRLSGEEMPFESEEEMNQFAQDALRRLADLEEEDEDA